MSHLVDRLIDQLGTKVAAPCSSAVAPAVDLSAVSTSKLFDRLEGAQRVIYWIACMQRGPTGIVREELFELREKAIKDREATSAELAKRRAISPEEIAEWEKKWSAEWRPSDRWNIPHAASEQAKCEIAKVLGNRRHPYFNRKSAGHAAAVARMQKLFATAYGRPVHGH